MHTDRPGLRPRVRRRAQRGVAAVEFALGAMLFFVFVCGLMEVARALYLWTTMVEVTRRAARMAAYTDLKDPAAIDQLLRRAMFGADTVPLGGSGLSKANLNLDYLNSAMTPVEPRHCAAQNVINCYADPYGASCIRFVRVRLCAAGGGALCQPLVYTPLVGIDFGDAALHYPSFSTLVPAGTLGHQNGQSANCP